MKIEGIFSFFHYRKTPSPKKTSIQIGRNLPRKLIGHLIGELKDWQESKPSTYTTCFRLGCVFSFFRLAHSREVTENAAQKLIKLLSDKKLIKILLDKNKNENKNEKKLLKEELIESKKAAKMPKRKKSSALQKRSLKKIISNSVRKNLTKIFQTSVDAAEKESTEKKEAAKILTRQELSALRGGPLGKIISKPVYKDIIATALAPSTSAAKKDAREELNGCLL